MKPPKCPTCGKAEWSHLCGGARLVIRASGRGVEVVSPQPGGHLRTIAVRRQRPTAPPDSPAPVVVDAPRPKTGPAGATAIVEPRKRAPKGSFDKKTYQRDLMRARRAKQKEPTDG